jgi:hypothetical protein
MFVISQIDDAMFSMCDHRGHDHIFSTIAQAPVHELVRVSIIQGFASAKRIFGILIPQVMSGTRRSLWEFISGIETLRHDCHR